VENNSADGSMQYSQNLVELHYTAKNLTVLQY